jgi:hypothetical protein
MKVIPKLLLLFALSVTSFAQNDSRSQSGCALLDKGRDALFITFERLEEPGPRRQGIDRERLMVRLYNNSTCVVLMQTMDAENFYLPLPDNPTAIDRVKRGINYDLPDGVVVPAVKYYTQNTRRSKAPEPAWGGDMFFTFRLLGGRSVLFAVPTAYFTRGFDIVLPFDFGWEKEGERPKVTYSGDVEHRVYFRNNSIPEEAWKKIGRR